MLVSKVQSTSPHTDEYKNAMFPLAVTERNLPTLNLARGETKLQNKDEALVYNK